MHNMNIPIITLEVERMKHTICVALAEHTVAMDSNVQAAIEAYCTDENIAAIVRRAAMEAIDAAVKEEVRSFFQWNKPGRQAVREAVFQYLDEWDKSRAIE